MVFLYIFYRKIGIPGRNSSGWDIERNWSAKFFALFHCLQLHYS